MPIDFIRRVIVKFNDSLINPRIPNAAELFLRELTSGDNWRQLVARFPGVRIDKLLTVLTQTQLLDLINHAFERNPEYRRYAPNFLTYFAIPCPKTVIPKEVVDTLSSPPWNTIVQRVHIEGSPSEEFPSVNPDQNPDWTRDDTAFLRKAPEGIDAEFAWRQNGGDGLSVQLVDIESAWDLDHPDLPPANGTKTPLIYGDPRHYTNAAGVTSVDHGTGVLGIVVAADNTLLNLGVTPSVKAMVASYWRKEPDGWMVDRQNAISVALKKLNDGDVLLLEMQIDDDSINLKNLPVEYDKDVFDLIQLGTNSGRVIVEAAGNGGHDLDNLPVYTPWLVRSRGQDDSGAILVSAATWTVPHVPVTVVNSTDRVHNYGSRIDCYAWGENIYTTKSGGSFQTFGGTSGASAIIAGAALSVQGMAVARSRGTRLTPLHMRDALSDPGRMPGGIRNTKSGGTDDKIGVMPNLESIFFHLP